jgi:hypothetical protein
MTRNEYRRENGYHASFLTQVATYIAPEDQKGMVDPEFLGANRKDPPMLGVFLCVPGLVIYRLLSRR